jgi:hypothetical protein
MSQYRNIDEILHDAVRIEPIMLSSQDNTNWSFIPEVSDEVYLKTDRETIIVEVTSVSDNKETFRGTVTHGYFPKEKEKWINVGDLVEFSQKKIAGIQKKQKNRIRNKV